MDDTLPIVVDELLPESHEPCEAAGCEDDADKRLRIGGVQRFVCWRCLSIRLLDMFPAGSR
jgi:hypothetical protein